MSETRRPDRLRRALLAVLATLAPTARALAGDPVPFAPTEERWQDWLGLGVGVLLVVAVSVVAIRVARAPGADPGPGDDDRGARRDDTRVSSRPGA